MAWNVAEAGEKQRLLLVLGVNLGLNILWSYLFFAWRRPDWALIEVVFLWVSIVVLMIVLYGIRPASGLLMLPYFAWVSVASYLTLTIVRINPAFGSS
jgi:tryptophan-rich sensory protein